MQAASPQALPKKISMQAASPQALAGKWQEKKKSQWSTAGGKPSGTATQNILKIYCPSTIKKVKPV